MAQNEHIFLKQKEDVLNNIVGGAQIREELMKVINTLKLIFVELILTIAHFINMNNKGKKYELTPSRILNVIMEERLKGLAEKGWLDPGDTLTINAKATVTAVRQELDGSFTVEFTIQKTIL